MIAGETTAHPKAEEAIRGATMMLLLASLLVVMRGVLEATMMLLLANLPVVTHGVLEVVTIKMTITEEATIVMMVTDHPDTTIKAITMAVMVKWSLREPLTPTSQM